jgi:hypothetical protein
MTSTQVVASQCCTWGRCTRKALYAVTENAVNEGTSTKAMCSQHRIATSNEAWSYGALVTWVKF